MKISADGSNMAVVTSHNFYLFNSNNPTIDELYEFKLIFSLIGLAVFVGMGATTGVLHLILRIREAKKEKIRLEKEKIEKEVKVVIETLDGKFKEWNGEEESEKI